ncbi:hypothetical protein [Actinomadura hibisca]|uniref:hypothetical protein n=1 Tax=Actinomadura hibisca TaxID=68565 RepID=UPI00082B0661|nr:hypothetical protein [Actinomadura hibisca]
MSRELIALLAEAPEIHDALANTPDLQDKALSISGNTGPVHLFDATGRLLVRLTEPRRVAAPGEAERLLGIPAPCPHWWVEVRSAATIPQAELLAWLCADALVAKHGGQVWSPTAP